jgi:predicted ATPase
LERRNSFHRLCGELAGRLPYLDPAKAEDSFRTALAIAREQGTRGYELHAATSLARLWCKQGRRGEARDLLAPLYGSFAVLKLTTSSNLVGYWTGSSLGLAPFRM